MARPIWKGTISFGLVNVPVEAHTAVRDHDVHFHQLDKRSGSRIRNRKVAESTGREVDKEHIALGFEISDGRYVTFDRKELEKLKPRSTRTIDVTDFVPLEQIDPIFYERTYWLAPSDDAGKKAYQLLLAAMEDRDRAAIGSVVMRNKQYLTAVRPLDGVLAMSTMRFADEVVPRTEAEVRVPKGKVEPKALKMATQLVDALASDWKPEQYHDTFVEELRDRIQAKDEGEEVVETEVEETPTAKVVDLAAALEESLRSARPTSARRSRSKPKKSRATSGTARRSPRTRTTRRVRS